MYWTLDLTYSLSMIFLESPMYGGHFGQNQIAVWPKLSVPHRTVHSLLC